MPNALRTLLLVFAMLAHVQPAFALKGPSFRLDECAWNATHILVVTEGAKIDGIVEVKESWKGGLNKGDVLTVPELAAFAPEKARMIAKNLFEKDDPQRPTHVTCSRMVLFLVRSVEQGEAAKLVWRPANRFEAMHVSLAWIEHDKVYVMAQRLNPGPTEIVGGSWTEADLQNRVMQIVTMRAALTATVSQSDTAKVMDALLRCLRFESYDNYVGNAALALLGQSGKGTLPVLRQALKDESLRKYHPAVLEAMGKAGDVEVGPDLTKVLEQELAFWKKIAPGLHRDWWQGEGLERDEVKYLQQRWSIAFAALETLWEVRYVGCRTTVTEFRDYWRSLPQLNFSQINEACEAILKKLR
jgi:hypothetical protein